MRAEPKLPALLLDALDDMQQRVARVACEPSLDDLGQAPVVLAVALMPASKIQSAAGHGEERDRLTEREDGKASGS